GGWRGWWEGGDGLDGFRVGVWIGVMGMISELKPLVTVESIAHCLKSGNLAVFRGAPEWSLTHQVIGKGLQEVAEQNGIFAGAWALIDRPEKDVAGERIRAGEADPAFISGGRGGRWPGGLRCA